MAREGAGGELALAFRGRTFVLSFNMTCIRIQDEVAKAIFLMAGLTGALLYHHAHVVEHALAQRQQRPIAIAVVPSTTAATHAAVSSLEVYPTPALRPA